MNTKFIESITFNTIKKLSTASHWSNKQDNMQNICKDCNIPHIA